MMEDEAGDRKGRVRGKIAYVHVWKTWERSAAETAKETFGSIRPAGTRSGLFPTVSAGRFVA